MTQQINVEFNPIEKADVQLIKDSKVVKGVHHIGDIAFTSLQQCKVTAQVERPSPKEVSSPLSPKCPDSSPLTVPVSPKPFNPSLDTITPVRTKPLSPKEASSPQSLKGPDSSPLTVPSSPNLLNPYHKTIITVRTIGVLQSPWGVAVSNDGSHVTVTENCSDHVTVLDREGKKVKLFGGKRGSGKVKFCNPYGIAITLDNFILVTDNHRIQKVTMDGECIASVGERGSGRQQFNNPHGIVISSITGHIYIADSYNHRIQVLTPELTFYHSFGIRGSAEGQLNFPRDIAINSKGLLYVTDRDNNGIQVFTPEGQVVDRFGTKGCGPGQLYYPLGITIDRSTNLVYVTEEYNHRISIFTSEGQFVNNRGSMV